LGFVVAGSNTTPVLEFVEQALDEIAPTVFFTVMGHRVASVALGRDDGFDFGCGQFLPDRVSVVALVGQQCLNLVGDHPEQRPEALNVVALSRRQHEPEWATFGIASGVEFGAEASSRSAKCLGFLSPFFMPTAQ